MKKKETLTYCIYPFGATRNTQPVKEIKIRIDCELNDRSYKKIIKPQLETAVSILEQKYPGTSYWYCRK